MLRNSTWMSFLSSLTYRFWIYKSRNILKYVLLFWLTTMPRKLKIKFKKRLIKRKTMKIQSSYPTPKKFKLLKSYISLIFSHWLTACKNWIRKLKVPNGDTKCFLYISIWLLSISLRYFLYLKAHKEWYSAMESI